MAMKKHTRLDLVEGGNIFKQGDYVTLGFIPRDYTGASVDLTDKQIEGSIFNGSTGVIYEGPASFVDGKIFFTIKQVLNDGKFQLEFTVTDAADPEYRTKFPTDDYASELTIKPSADNLDYVGVSMTTVAQLRTEQEQKQQQFELAIVPQVDELKQRVEEGIGAFTEDTEVKDARMDEINLRTFNQKVVAQLAEKATKEEVQALASGTPKGTFSTVQDLQSAFPSGAEGVYVVTSDGTWRYWDGAEWKSGGIYQTSLVKEGLYASNKVTNGNFDSAAGWNVVSSANGTIAAANNELTYTIASLVSTSRLQSTTFVPVVGHKYYVRGDILPKHANTSYIQLGDSAPIANNTPTPNQWNKIAGIITATSTLNPSFKFYHVTNANYSVGDTFKYRKILVANLTEIFGAGNEPSALEFEKLLAQFPSSWINENLNQLKAPVYLETAFDSVVEKEEGKGLSTNDFSDSDKFKVSSIIARKIISVKKDGTGDFTNMRAALASIPIPLSEDNQYEIQFFEEFDVFADYTQAEIEASNFVGLITPKYVHLRGIGVARGMAHLKGELPDSYAESAKTRVATLATLDTGDLINIKVSGRNLRYAVHDDYNYPGYVRNVIDCDFIKYAGGGYVQAYGEGCWSGTRTVFENCTFHTETNGMPYSCHNNTNFAKPSYHRIEGCKFTNKAGLTAIRFGSVGSGQRDVVELVNNSFSGQIKLFEESADSGVGIDFDVKGYGNDVVPIEVIHTKASQQVTYDLIGQTKEMYNGHTAVIPKGTILKYNSFGNGVVPLTSGDSAIRFAGIAMEDIAVADLGFVRIGGYLPLNETALAAPSLGQKIGIVDGTLAVVTGGDYIGYYEVNNYIRLI